jgi:hypothetical protein
MTAGVLVASAVLLTGCGSDRSVAAFCSTFQSQATALHAKYTAADQAEQGGSEDGALGGLLTLAQAPGDFTVMFTALDQHAPSDIEPSVAEVLDSLKQSQEAMSSGNVVGMLVGGLSASLSSGGAWQSVNDYIQQNCDLSFEK